MGRKNNLLWDYFTVMPMNEGATYSCSSKGRKNKLARCTLCRRAFKMCEGSTSGLRTHLSQVHASEHFKLNQREKEQAEEEEKRRKEEEENASQQVWLGKKDKRGTPSQPKITGYGHLSKVGKKSQEQLYVDAELTLLLVGTGVSFHVLGTDAWKRWMEFAYPQAHLKTPNTHAQHKLPMIYRNLKEDVSKMLQKDLEGVRQVALTSDGWQASNQKCFLAVTLHYINQRYQYRSVLLECKGYQGQHTGVAIAAVLQEILLQYPRLGDDDLTRVCTTDGAANMKTAIKATEPQVSQLICVAHMLNNAIQEAVTKSPAINLVVNIAKDLSQRLHRSKVDCEIIEEYCLENNVAFRKVIQPCKTRWNSIANMVTSLLVMRPAFEAIRLSNEPNTLNLRAEIPTEDQFNTLQAMDPLLQLIKHYTTIFEADKPLIHTFLVHIHNMRAKITKMRVSAQQKQGVYSHLEADDLEHVSLVMEFFEKVFVARLQKYSTDMNYAVAAVLNPQYKGVPLFAMNMYDRTIDYMVDHHYTTKEILDQTRPTRDTSCLDNSSDDSDEGDLTQADKENRQRIKLIANRQVQAPRDRNAELPLRAEISRYEVYDSAKPDEDHLEWWDKHQRDFPLLAEYARNTMCLQVTSAQSERVFSLGGRIVNKLRSGLSHKTTEMIVFTEQNMKYVPRKLTSWNLHNKTAENQDAATSSSEDEEAVGDNENPMPSTSQMSTSTPIQERERATPRMRATLAKRKISNYFTPQRTPNEDEDEDNPPTPKTIRSESVDSRNSSIIISVKDSDDSSDHSEDEPSTSTGRGKRKTRIPEEDPFLEQSDG